MNSGWYDNEISKILVSINVDFTHVKKKKLNEKISSFFIETNLNKKLIITSVKLRGKIKSKETIEKKQKKEIEKKKK